ncbi:MAG: urease accessory protein UreD, partial [Pseudomonadota bacterium]
MAPFVGSEQVRVTAAPQRTTGVCRLSIRGDGSQNALGRLYQEGAYKVRLPRKAPGDALEAVLINTSGGLTGGDKMALTLDIGDQASAVITTQACEKFYKSTGAPVSVSSDVTVGENAVLHWLPQESILFDRAHVQRDLIIKLAPSARLVALEAVLLGRKWKNETFEIGQFTD